MSVIKKYQIDSLKLKNDYTYSGFKRSDVLTNF